VWQIAQKCILYGLRCRPQAAHCRWVAASTSAAARGSARVADAVTDADADADAVTAAVTDAAADAVTDADIAYTVPILPFKRLQMQNYVIFEVDCG
jgi:hypothetical protein